MTQKLSFAVEDVSLYGIDDPTSQFAKLKVDCFSTEKSLHDTFVTEDTLRKMSSSILLKPFVFAVDKNLDDLSTHLPEEMPGGFVPQNSPIEFKLMQSGATMMGVDVLVWRRYSGKLLEYFSRKDNKTKGVSVEIEVMNSRYDPISGLTELLEFCFSAITALGDFVTPAMGSAQAVLVFAKEYEEDYIKEFGSRPPHPKYGDIDFTIPENIKNIAKKALETHKNSKGGQTAAVLAASRHLVSSEKSNPDKIRFINKHISKTNDELKFNLLGGKDSLTWSNDICKQLDDIDNKNISYFSDEEDAVPYSKISEINPALKGIEPPISLGQANSIAKQADAIGSDKEKNGWAISISEFKKSHEVKDGKWVEKKNMSDEKEYAKENSGNGTTLKVDKSKEKLSQKSWGDVDKTSLMHKVMESSNRGALVHDVYMLVEEGWEEHPSSSLKYPVMQIIGDTLVYNRYGLSAALQRAEGQGESSVVSKVKGIYNKMGIGGDEKNNKEAMSMEDEEKDKMAVDTAKDEEKETPEEEKKETPEEEKKEEEKGLEKKFGVSEKFVSKMESMSQYFAEDDGDEDDVKMAAEELKKGEFCDAEKVAMGLYCKMCKMSEKMTRLAEENTTYMAENEQLKGWKSESENNQKMFEVESTLKELSDKVVIPAETMSEMREEAAKYNYANIDAWKNFCKAKSFDFAVKPEGKNKKDEVTRIGMPFGVGTAKKPNDLWA